MDCYMLLRLCYFKAKLALSPEIKSIVLPIFLQPKMNRYTPSIDALIHSST